MRPGETWEDYVKRLARAQGLDPDEIEAGTVLPTDGTLGALDVVRGETTDGRASLDVVNENCSAAPTPAGGKSAAEERFLALWHVYGEWERFGQPRRQVRIIPNRKFVSDFVWTWDGFKLLVVEIEGMTGRDGHVGGHRSTRGLQRDARKYNLAALNGWGSVYRVPSWWLFRGYERQAPRVFIEEINALLANRALLLRVLAEANTDEARALLAMMRFEEVERVSEA